MKKAVVGVAENGNSVVLVTVRGEEAIDRRKVDLTHGLPTHPYHHEGSWAIGRYRSSWSRPISLPDAIALVEKVHAAADRGAREALSALSALSIGAIAIRACADLPASIEERIRDPRAANMADSILYRQALAKAAKALGWNVRWYDSADVLESASASILREMGRAIGSPWTAREKLAAAAALAAIIGTPFP